jgi:bifunctional DNase/RNase
MRSAPWRLRVVITEMRDSIFYADITFDNRWQEVAVSSRPSDAIALAVRTGTPIFAHPQVIDEAGVLRTRTSTRKRRWRVPGVPLRGHGRRLPRGRARELIGKPEPGFSTGKR